MSIRIPSTLIDAVELNQAVLFAGAGMSIKALGFAGTYVRDAVGEKIQRDYPAYNFATRSLEEACDEYAVIAGRDKLLEFLAALVPQNAAPLPGHIAAIKMFRFIVTTNWDLLFEAAYKQIGQHYQVLATEADAPSFNWDQHNLLKIHGSADRPLTMIATTEDFENYPDTHASLLDRVGELLWSNTVLFVGYGLADEHVRRILAHIRHRKGPFTSRAYAVMGKGFGDEVRTLLLRDRGIEVLPYDSDELLPELAVRAGIQ